MSNTPAVSKTHAVRDENGKFAAKVSTSQSYLRQAAVDANINHWIWLAEHGYGHVHPSEVFAGAAKPSDSEQMTIDLVNLRLSDAEWEQPFQRLTDEQLTEIEDERPGEEFSSQPYLY